MIVMKFGGTSVGSASQIQRVGKIIETWLPSKPTVVVSAVGGITDRLIRLSALLVSPERNAEAVELRDGDPGLAADRVQQVGAVVLLVQGWVAELVHETVGDAADRRLDGRGRTLPCPFGPEDLRWGPSRQSIQSPVMSTIETRIRSGASPTRVQNTSSPAARTRTAQ